MPPDWKKAIAAASVRYLNSLGANQWQTIDIDIFVTVVFDLPIDLIVKFADLNNNVKFF